MRMIHAHSTVESRPLAFLLQLSDVVLFPLCCLHPRVIPGVVSLCVTLPCVLGQWTLCLSLDRLLVT